MRLKKAEDKYLEEVEIAKKIAEEHKKAEEEAKEKWRQEIVDKIKKRNTKSRQLSHSRDFSKQES